MPLANPNSRHCAASRLHCAFACYSLLRQLMNAFISPPPDLHDIPELAVRVVKRAAKWSTSVALVLFLAGCAHFESKSISSAEMLDRYEARTLENPRLKEFLEKGSGHSFPNWPLKSWDFATLTL